MRGKKARAIRRKHGVKHARLAKPQVVTERGAPSYSRPLMALSPTHLRKLYQTSDKSVS